MRHMRVLIVFDSAYGNTERIAGAIGAALEPQGTVSRSHARLTCVQVTWRLSTC
jgi:flavodoxin